MLHWLRTDFDAKIIVTLNENRTLAGDTICYLFTFTHVITKQVNSFVYSTGDDESTAQNRYNQFTLDVSNLFTGFPNGEYHYAVYQQASSTNIDPTLSDGLVEQGKMYLKDTPANTFTTFQDTTTFIVYE